MAGSDDGLSSILPPDSAATTHLRLVFPDPVAFRYLEEDPSTKAIDRHAQLTGYELYLVEQWACSREHPTFVIATFTGLPQHVIQVGVLSVVADEKAWSPRLRVYLKAVSNFHAKTKETPLGVLMVTNLSGFPSALNVISVPGGDVKAHRENFFVNENLKRMGCAGRSGLTLSTPSASTVAKFRQMYRTSESVPISATVIELVKLCQAALVLFKKLAPEYADGLLCDVTEKAINDWWTEIGIEHYNVEPSDGNLGPTTVAALIGLFLGARNRLAAYGAPVAKDAFEVRAMKRAIGYFQRTQKLNRTLERTRRLDRETLDCLHRVTTKAASSDGWGVPRAVKSTVAELGGKGGEMVIGMVAGKEKAGISEVETFDIGRLAETATGEHAKWLWQGKPRKHHHGELFDDLAGEDDMVFSGDEQSGYIWSSRKRGSVPDPSQRVNGDWDDFDLTHRDEDQGSVEGTDRDQALRRTIMKGVSGRVTDARTGFGRFKDAVGRQTIRSNRDSKDFSDQQRRLFRTSERDKLGKKRPRKEALAIPGKALLQRPKPPRILSRDVVSSPDEDLEPMESYFVKRENGSRSRSRLSKSGPSTPMERDSTPAGSVGPASTTRRRRAATVDTDNLPKRGRRDILSEDQKLEKMASKRRRSMDQFQDLRNSGLTRPAWPRFTSFSAADDLLHDDDPTGSDDTDTGDLDAALAREKLLIARQTTLAMQLDQLEQELLVDVHDEIKLVEELDVMASRDQEDINTIQYQRQEDFNTLRNGTSELLSSEQSALAEKLKALEAIGSKLEYELNAVASKIEDVEEAVDEYERQVIQLEDRVQELEGEEEEQKRKESSKSWFRWLSGSGKPKTE